MVHVSTKTFFTPCAQLPHVGKNNTAKLNTNRKPKETAQTNQNITFSLLSEIQEMTKEQYPEQLELSQIDDFFL